MTKIVVIDIITVVNDVDQQQKSERPNDPLKLNSLMRPNLVSKFRIFDLQ